LTIGELVDIALQNHPQTSKTWWSIKKASDNTERVRGAYYPRLNLRADAINGHEYRFIKGPEVGYTEFSAGLSLHYLLLDFGERNANLISAETALTAVRWHSDWTVQKVMYKVIASTYEFLREDEFVDVREQSLQDAELALKTTVELNRVGLKSNNDIYAMQTMITEIKMAIIKQKAARDIAYGKLISSLGLDLDEEICVAELPEPTEVPCQDLSALIDIADNQRSDLLAQRALLDQKHAQALSAQKKYNPKLSLNADSGYKRYVDDKAHTYNYRAALNLDIPLFTGFEDKYNQLVAYAEAEETLADVKDLQLDIALEILTTIIKVESTQELLKLSRDNLEFATKTYQGVLDQYKIGTKSIFELNEAQRQLTHARLQLVDVKIHWFTHLAQLAYSIGTISQFTEASCLKSE
jgi:outer membrane protein